MTVHRKCAIVLVILCANRCMTRSPGADIRNNNVSEASGEDENIKQALVLVNLLKHEYVKAIRENHVLRMRTTPTEESTCAPGDRPTSMSELATTDPYFSTPQQPAPIPMSGRRFAVMTPFQQSMGRNGSKPNYLYRRRVPVDYYYGSGAGPSVVGNDYPVDHFRRQVPYRRKEGPPDASNKPPDPVIPDLVTSDPVPSDPVITDPTILDSIPPNPVTSDPDTAEPVTQDPDILDPDATEADATESDGAYPEEAENTLDGIEEDPVQAQIDSELKVELKATLPAAKTHVSNEMTKRTKKTYLQLMKPTPKVYLGGSTRYPIPLPENHAFCYTNPRNPLCRTVI